MKLFDIVIARTTTVSHIILTNSVTPIIISLIALLWSMANTYFTFFWHPQDLRVYLRFPPEIQAGTDRLDLNYVFSNTGNQEVFIEDVGVYELWLTSRHSTTPASDLHLCDELLSIRRPVSLASGKSTSSQMPGVLISFYRPEKIYVDGTEQDTSSTIVGASKFRVINSTFRTDRIPEHDYNATVVCPIIDLFDSNGSPVLAVCKGYKSIRTPGHILGSLPANYERPATLLPLSHSGSCQSIHEY